MTDVATTRPYGVLGRVLGHTYTPTIYKELAGLEYVRFEREPEDLEAFMTGDEWEGTNVTIPYKADAAAAADERSPRVRRLGVANTLVRRPDGTIYAENTDVLGFAWMLERFCRRELGGSANEVLLGKKCLVLGSGGASQAVQAALEDVGAAVVVVSRAGEDNYGNLLERHADASLVVNTTPVGMFPSCPATPVADEDLARMAGLLGVLDVVYNPNRTGICLAAESLGLPSESGLAMLVAQAFFASELFQGKKLDEASIEPIELDIERQTRNIVLIGMPGAGKTTTGKRLARLLSRPFVDIDDEVALRSGQTAAQIIEQRGEDAFRKVETEVTGDVCSRSGLVVACGGGVVTRPCNRDLLRQNGVVVMVDRPLGELSSKGRPVSAAKGIERLAAERMDAYRSWSDIQIECTGTAEGDAKVILSKVGF